MGWFGKIGNFVGSTLGHGIRKFGEIGGEAIKRFGSIKHSYNNINNMTNGLIGKSIESIPFVGGILGNVGKFLDNKESIKTLESVLNRSKVYGQDLERIGRQIG
jgi:hypothetical protein